MGPFIDLINQIINKLKYKSKALYTCKFETKKKFQKISFKNCFHHQEFFFISLDLILKHKTKRIFKYYYSHLRLAQ